MLNVFYGYYIFFCVVNFNIIILFNFVLSCKKNLWKFYFIFFLVLCVLYILLDWLVSGYLFIFLLSIIIFLVILGFRIYRIGKFLNREVEKLVVFLNCFFWIFVCF